VVQAWDFTAGSDWVHEMQNAMSTAERVVAVLSPDYLNSAYGEAEWRALYAQDPSGERRQLLPVRVREIDSPWLRTRVYLDLVGLKSVAAREALLAAVRRVRAKPHGEPEFPGLREPPAPRFPVAFPEANGEPRYLDATLFQDGRRQPDSEALREGQAYDLEVAVQSPRAAPAWLWKNLSPISSCHRPATRQ